MPLWMNAHIPPLTPSSDDKLSSQLRSADLDLFNLMTVVFAYI